MFRVIWRRRRRVIHPDKSKITFRHGQSLMVLGRQFSIMVMEDPTARYSRAKVKDGTVIIKLSGELDSRKSADQLSLLARRSISKAVGSLLEQRVNDFNARYFNSTLGKIRIKDNISNWGSISRANNINIDFRLLLAPYEILDAVIMHELAHTKHRNHSKDFHKIVLDAIPDYKERMKWLRSNGQKLTTDQTNLIYGKINQPDIKNNFEDASSSPSQS